jgi:predicted short-subunit dehydrogenase-like oxidoreductase (DUF2520 family)
MRQMLLNIERHGPRAAWTGPLAREDYATIARHVRVLRGQPRETQEMYRAATLLAARLLAANPRAVKRRAQKIFDSPGGKV